MSRIVVIGVDVQHRRLARGTGCRAVFAAAIVVSGRPDRVRRAPVALRSRISDADLGAGRRPISSPVPVLIAVVLLAIRARRGRLGLRELLDGTTVTAGAGLAAWIAIANPAWTTGVDLRLAVAAAAYVPIAFMLLTFAARTAARGSRPQPGDVAGDGRSAGNFGATIVRGLVQTDVVSDGASQVVAGRVHAPRSCCCASASCHPHAPAILHRMDDERDAPEPRDDAARTAVAEPAVARCCSLARRRHVDDRSGRARHA